MEQNHGCAVIFGGGGFIGLNLAKHLLDTQRVKKVYLADLPSVQCPNLLARSSSVYPVTQLERINVDVREPIALKLPETVSLIGNFAAVHREPGHEPGEYFETNLKGAQHVCDWAEQIDCRRILFTSSISVYGPSDQVAKTEQSIPMPDSAYGASKLAAEKIHETWLAADRDHRHLVIVRPGVVFGAYEGGNVSRMIRALQRNYFVFTGNKAVCKAGIYVKELCAAMLWVLDYQQEQSRHFILFNGVMPDSSSLETYVHVICIQLDRADHQKRVLNIPFSILYVLSAVVDLIASTFNLSLPVSRVRVKKLMRSNRIDPTFLLEQNYPYQYSLRQAFEDWFNEAPEEWGRDTNRA